MLFIDDRAGSRDLAQLPPLNDPNLNLACLTRLRSADVSFLGGSSTSPTSIGIEYKSLADLLSSIDTGRLSATQAPRMLEDYNHCYLLYYGEYRCDVSTGYLQVLRPIARGRKTRWHTYTRSGPVLPETLARALKAGRRPRIVQYAYLEGYLLTLAAAGITVHHVASPLDAAPWLATLYHWYQRTTHTALHSFDQSAKSALIPGLDPLTRTRACIAAQLPGIGYKLGVRVAQHFTSTAAMVNASADEWQCIPGIGKSLATSAVDMLHRSSKASKG